MCQRLAPRNLCRDYFLLSGRPATVNGPTAALALRLALAFLLLAKPNNYIRPTGVIESSTFVPYDHYSIHSQSLSSRLVLPH